MNLLITCARNLESETENEIRKILNESGDQEPEIYKSDMRGILFINTNIETSKIIDYVNSKNYNNNKFIIFQGESSTNNAYLLLEIYYTI